MHLFQVLGAVFCFISIQSCAQKIRIETTEKTPLCAKHKGFLKVKGRIKSEWDLTWRDVTPFF